MADLQSLINMGMTPQDAASLLADLQRYETAGVPNMGLGVAPQATVANGVEYQNQYGGMDIIPGMTSGIFSRLGIENPQLPVYNLMEAQAQNNPNDARRMSFMPTPGSAYRLVDNTTGDVVMSATTPEEYAALAQRANDLAASEGKRANFEIQRQDPQSIGGGFTPIYSDTPDVAFDTTAQLLAAGMLAMTGAGALQPGGFGGVGAAGAASAAPVATGAGLATGASLAPGALASLPANLAAIQAGASSALAGAGLGAGAVGGGLLATAAPAIAEAAPIIVTAPAAASAIPASAVLGAGAGTGLTAGLLANAQPTALPEVGPMDTPQNSFLGNLTKNMGLTDYMTLGSLGASALGSLFGGAGTGSGATTPYVSPFGSGGLLGASGKDYRANPTIADYEQYGFGPEATFFKPEYNSLVSQGSTTFRPLING